MQKLIIVLSSRQDSFLSISLAHHPALGLMGDQPVIQYLIDEAKASGVKEIILVGRTPDKEVYSYLTAKGKGQLGKLDQVVQDLVSRNKDITFQFLGMNKNFSGGEVILKLKPKLKNPWGMVWYRGILVSSVPGLQQLEKIFNTSQKPVLGLIEAAVEKQWVLEYEKIAQRIFKIEQIRKAKKKENQENLHLSGRYILTPEIIDFLEQLKKSGVKKENLRIDKALSLMLDSGQPVYGYQLKGDWLSLDSKENWLKANLYMTLHHPDLGSKLQDYLKGQHLC